MQIGCYRCRTSEFHCLDRLAGHVRVRQKAESIRGVTFCFLIKSEQQIGFQDVWIYQNIQYL